MHVSSAEAIKESTEINDFSKRRKIWTWNVINIGSWRLANA